MDSCIFCKIIANAIPAERLYEDDSTIVIKDINPLAPTHLLAIPKKHVASVHDVPADEPELYSQLLAACKATIEKLGLAESGYRIVINSGESAGQTVFHLHVHLLSGRAFAPTPG